VIYEFKCDNCNLVFELKRPVSDCSLPANCPKCGKPAQRVYSGFQWIWAGSLFREDGSYRQDEDYAILKG